MRPVRHARRLAASLLAAGLAAGGLAGCGGSPPPPPPQSFAALNYDYLPPILLHVASLTVQNDYVPDPAAATLLGEAPQTPVAALTAMLQHRLVADGAPGSGTVTIENAGIEPSGDNYVGAMTLRLDVASADGRKTGFTEASVSVTSSAPEADATGNAVQAALYGMTKQLMEQMNVQLQYQIQRNMGSWIGYGSAAATPAAAIGNGIETSPLAAPGTAGAPAGLVPLAPGPATPGPAVPGPVPTTSGAGGLPEGNLSGELPPQP